MKRGWFTSYEAKDIAKEANRGASNIRNGLTSTAINEIKKLLKEIYAKNNNSFENISFEKVFQILNDRLDEIFSKVNAPQDIKNSVRKGITVQRVIYYKNCMEKSVAKASKEEPDER